MKILREVGPLKNFIPRPREVLDKRFDKDMYEWHAYQRKSKEHAKVLEANRPDIVTKLNQIWRNIQEKEKLEKTLEREKEMHREEWSYCAEYGEYCWIGDGKPPENDDDINLGWNPTEEDYRRWKAEEDREIERQIEERKEFVKQQRRIKQENRKAKMKEPVKPPPAGEPCEYEKIRENIIRERQEAMDVCGFFEDLKAYKKKIGLEKE